MHAGRHADIDETLDYSIIYEMLNILMIIGAYYSRGKHYRWQSRLLSRHGNADKTSASRRKVKIIYYDYQLMASLDLRHTLRRIDIYGYLLLFTTRSTMA